MAVKGKKKKKESNSWLRKSLNCRLLQAGKGLEKSISVAGSVLTLLFCWWLLSGAGHHKRWPKRSTPTFLPSLQKPSADLSPGMVPKRPELKSKTVRSKPPRTTEFYLPTRATPDPYLESRCISASSVLHRSSATVSELELAGRWSPCFEWR